LKLIDTARKSVAIAMAVFGAGFAICTRRDDYLTGTLRWEPGIWAWGKWVLGIGVLTCLIATFALIVEYMARPAAPKPITLRSLFIRSLFILIAVVLISFSMTFAYGPPQAIGAVIGAFLLLAAWREQTEWRVVLAVLAAMVFGLTLWGTQTPYQYAHRHADEIVAAGSELADQCSHTYRGQPDLDQSEVLAHIGQEVAPGDPRVPSVLRTLGAKRIWVNDERVAIYVGGNQEFQIYREPHPNTVNAPIWASHIGKSGSTKLTDRLWATDD
jgi:hypothetical protein